MWQRWLNRLGRRLIGRCARRAAPCRRPRLEVLEQRSLPAVAFGFQGAIGGLDLDEGYSVAADAAGNVYLTGTFSGTVDFDFGPGVSDLTSVLDSQDVFVAKYGADGSLLWARSMGGACDDAGLGIAVDGAGNAYVTGFFEDTASFGATSLTSAGCYDVFVSKLDSGGNHLWATGMGGADEDVGQGIALDAAGNVHTTGYFSCEADFGTTTLCSAGCTDVFVSKLDAGGNHLWATGMGGYGEDEGTGIAVDGSGNVYTTGYFSCEADFGCTTLCSAGCTDVFVSKLDAGGNHLWATGMGGYGEDEGTGVAVDGSGDVYVTGLFSCEADFGGTCLSSAGGYDVFVSKLDSAGNTLWAKSVGGCDDDVGAGIAVDSAGNVYITGYFSGEADFDGSTLSSAGCFDVFVSKLDSGGNTLWAKSMGGSDEDVGLGIALDARGNVYTTGAFDSTDATFGTTTLGSAGCFDVFVSQILQDSQAPGTSAALSGSQGSNGWYYTPVQVSLSASDNNTGVAGIFYRVDGGAWQSYTGPFSVSGNAGHTVEYYSVDGLGNTEAVQSVSFTIEDRFVILGNGLLVNGTDGNDTFTFSADASNVYVSVNGAYYQASRTEIRNVVLDGKGGSDTGYYWGTAASEGLWIGPGWAVLTDFSYFLYAGSMEVQYVAGGGGFDYAAVYGSGGSDYLYTAAGVSYLLDWASYGNGLFGFSGVVVDGQGGLDQAFYYDAAGNDTFVAAPGVAGLSDSFSYYSAAYGFAVNYGLMTSGGLDQAFLVDSAGQDVFVKEGGSYALSGEGHVSGAAYPVLAYVYSSSQGLWYGFSSFGDPFATSFVV